MKIRMFSITEYYKNKYEQAVPYLKQKNTQVFTTIILTLFALSFFGIFAISPTLSTIANLQKQLEDNRFVDESLSKKITNLSILQRKFNELGSDTTVILTAIPKDPNVPMLMSQVHLLALNSNLSVTGMQAFQVELSKILDNPQQYSSYSFSLAAQGSYDDIVAFVSDLVTFERIVAIDTLAINRAQKNEDTVFQVSLRGEAYFKK